MNSYSCGKLPVEALYSERRKWPMQWLFCPLARIVFSPSSGLRTYDRLIHHSTS